MLTALRKGEDMMDSDSSSRIRLLRKQNNFAVEVQYYDGRNDLGISRK